MNIEDCKRTVENFIKYLQLPESIYTLTESDNSDGVEMQIAKGDVLESAVSITNGSCSILFNGEYDENKFFKKDFQSPIYLLYIISVVYYSTVCKEVGITFDDLMTIVLGEEITNWKELVVTLAKMVMLKSECKMDEVLLEDKTISYDDETGKIEYGTLDFQIEPHSYTELIEAIFLIVEYVACINDTQDTLFTDEAKDNLIEEEQSEEVPMGGFPMGGMDDDIGLGGDLGGGAPEPVTPDEAENMPDELGADFSLPDGLDEDGMDDLISIDEEE